MKTLLTTLALTYAAYVSADIPVHCVYGQGLGTWRLYLTSNKNDETIQCPTERSALNVITSYTIELSQPWMAKTLTDEGYFTYVYDEGIEINIGGQKFFSFFDYTTLSNGTTISHCGISQVGMFHDAPVTVSAPPMNWGCYYMTKVSDEDGAPISPAELDVAHYHPALDERLHAKQQYEAARNRIVPEGREYARALQKHVPYKVAEKSFFAGKTYAEAQRAKGQTVYHSAASTMPRETDFAYTAEHRNLDKLRVQALPQNFDWSDYGFVPAVRDQGQCGSCYTFGSTGMLTSRMMITLNSSNVVPLAPQEIVSCSPYSQGCDGGFGYLVMKYGEDFGLTDTNAYPYVSGNGTVPPCRKTPQMPIYRASNYKYVGGAYGFATAEALQLELFYGGPVAVSFEVDQSFEFYSGGVYVPLPSNTTLGDFPQPNPFELTNHLVFVVGYGVDNVSGLPYWRVQNSWGRSWGENGFFRIIRGVDALAIESMPVAGTPVMPS